MLGPKTEFLSKVGRFLRKKR